MFDSTIQTLNNGTSETSPSVDVFWGELAPCDHLIQLYESDEKFLATLVEYVYSGLSLGESVVVIATEQHTSVLNEKLRELGVGIRSERRRHKLILLNAEETLKDFVGDDGWPNDDKFYDVIRSILRRARGAERRRVRAFGEMVAVLWARGQNAATVRLEHLWQKLCREEDLSLFCAYPKSGFTNYALKSLQDICDAHSKVIH